MNNYNSDVLYEISKSYCAFYKEKYGKEIKYPEGLYENIPLGYSFDPEWREKEGYEYITDDTHGVGEGWYSIFKWRGKFYRLNFLYRSHEGITWVNDAVTEVFPHSTIVTEYRSGN